MSNQEVAQQNAQAPSIAREFAANEQKLKSMLPAGMDVKKFMRTAVNGIEMHEQRDKLLKANRKTLFHACQKAAQDGLLLDGKEATLVVFGQDATYMPMTQGLVKLARKSGEISTIDGYVVYENDSFQYRPGMDPQPYFEPDWKAAPSKRGKPCLAYAVIGLKSGENIVRIMHHERIMQIANIGKNASQYDPNKGKHWQEWWIKTVLKLALKYAPKSTELEQALDNDNENFDLDDVPTQAPRQNADSINEDLGNKEEPGEAPAPEQEGEQQGEAAADQQQGETIDQEAGEQPADGDPI